jgi:hypothetical protein
MNRRERRRRARPGNRVATVAVVLIGVCLLGAVVVFTVVRNYLHSDAFRLLLSEKVSAAAGVKGGFSALRWDGFSVGSDAFTASGDGLIREMRLDHLHTEVGLGAVRRGVWELKDSRARRLMLTLDLAGVDTTGAAMAGLTAAPRSPGVDEGLRRSRPKRDGWLPRKIEVNGLELDDLALEALTKNGVLTARGMRVAVENAGTPGSHRARISGGTLLFPQQWLPPVSLVSAVIHSQPQGVFLTGLDAGGWSAARLQAGGEWDRLTHQGTLEGKLTGVKCEEVFNEDWSRRLTGVLATDFVLRHDDRRTSASGRLTLENGVLTALPVLDVLAAYVDTRRFRMLVLTEAHADWLWDDGVLVLDRIVLASESQIRVEGRFSLRDRVIDGDLMLGLAPGMLAAVPGAETDVFESGPRGMLWAPLRITGTIDKPREDLSDRMIAAAGLRLLETIPGSGGEKALKYSRALLGDESLEKGVKIIEEGSRTVREVGGLLDDILRGSRKRAPAPPSPEISDPQ